MTIENLIQEKLRALGFPLIGFLNRRDAIFKNSISNWVANGYHAEMKWMEENQIFKTDPCSIEPYGTAIICVAIPYNTVSIGQPLPQKLINRYAWGEDYHKLIKKRLQIAIQSISKDIPNFKARAFVDSAPLPEKQLAAKAGLGWIGKNSLLINPTYGSYLFLGEIVCNLEFQYDVFSVINQCGSCQKCVKSCPGDALQSSIGLNSNRCCSYLSIEKRGDFKVEEEKLIQDGIFGCDICQNVCPWNHNVPVSQESAFQCFERWKRLDLEQVVNLTEQEFEELKIKSAVKRAGLKGLKRNAAAFIKNSFEQSFND